MNRLRSAKCNNGVPVAPHPLAVEPVITLLSKSGNAAMVAAAATIVVVYPHMNAVGGMGGIVGSGTAVSFIQRFYHPFSSTIILPKSGVVGQNSESRFSLKPHVMPPLQPDRRLFHPFAPAGVYLTNSDVLAYGNMRGNASDQHWSPFLTEYAIKKSCRKPPFPLRVGCQAEAGARAVIASRLKIT